MIKKSGADPVQLVEKILQSAKKLFAGKGYHGASMRDIAREAECSQSMVSHHFGSKSELWNRIKSDSFDHYIQQICNSSFVCTKKNFEHTMSVFIDKRMAYLNSEPDMVRMITWQSLEGPEDGENSKIDKFMQKFVSDIREAQLRDELREDIAPELIAFFLLFATRAWFQDKACWVLKALGKSDEEGLKEYTVALKKLLKNGIFL